MLGSQRAAREGVQLQFSASRVAPVNKLISFLQCSPIFVGPKVIVALQRETRERGEY